MNAVVAKVAWWEVQVVSGSLEDATCRKSKVNIERTPLAKQLSWNFPESICREHEKTRHLLKGRATGAWLPGLFNAALWSKQAQEKVCGWTI